MVTVITYGTYDLLHYGHIKLLERAKKLGDYLIVGITADDYDKARGKINVQQSLEERIAAVRDTGIADKIIIEEYEGQKIDDIKKYDVDIFTVGSDWVGQFDYLEQYCKVVYLPRTEGVSSTIIRGKTSALRLGMVGYSNFLQKVSKEVKYVNAVRLTGLCVPETGILDDLGHECEIYTTDYASMLSNVDAVYIHSHPSEHYQQCKQALMEHRHVLCESPVALSRREYKELAEIAGENGCILMEGIKTAYTTAYSRMILLLKSGKIGKIVSVDATCTSLSTDADETVSRRWGAMQSWGPTALLPVLQILGDEFTDIQWFSMNGQDEGLDLFTKATFLYNNAVATINVGTGVKSEGELIVSGTQGYIYIPAPWWKTDYFEIRYENPAENKRYFYQLDGEGIRYELVAFANAARKIKQFSYIDNEVTEGIADMMDLFTAFKESKNKQKTI